MKDTNKNQSQHADGSLGEKISAEQQTETEKELLYKTLEFISGAEGDYFDFEQRKALVRLVADKLGFEHRYHDLPPKPEKEDEA